MYLAIFLAILIFNACTKSKTYFIKKKPLSGFGACPFECDSIYFDTSYDIDLKHHMREQNLIISSERFFTFIY